MEINMIITIISVGCAVFFGIQSYTRNKKQDTEMDAAEKTALFVKLENISSTVLEIKAEISIIKENLNEIRERLILVEASARQAHKRLDEMKGGR